MRVAGIVCVQRYVSAAFPDLNVKVSPLLFDDPSVLSRNVKALSGSRARLHTHLSWAVCVCVIITAQPV